MSEERQADRAAASAESADEQDASPAPPGKAPDAAAAAGALGEFLEAGPGAAARLAGAPGGEPGQPAAESASAPPPVHGAAATRSRRLRFTGEGWEYFRIWIVNVALTLLTLGVYSAWAKVRTRRYLYGHIWLGDASFDYTANPVAILRGRILVAIVAIGLWFANLFSILYYYAALLALAPLVPWVVIRARTFQLRNSRLYGIAFDFTGRFMDAAVWYPLMAVASFVTLGLAWPFRVFGRDRFLVDESRFGNRPFRFTGEASGYYGIYAVVWILGLMLFAGSCLALLAAVALEPDAETPSRVLNGLMPAFFALIGLASFVYLRTRLLSYRWSSTQLGDTDFILQLSFGRMFWIYASNAALIVATFGLFAPFARIRLFRYVVDQFLVMQPPREVAFEASEAQRLGATGAEAAGEFGLEIGI